MYCKQSSVKRHHQNAMDKNQLDAIANTRMPFGKHQGWRLIDLPEEYLLWFERQQAMPPGLLGELLTLTLLIKSEGLTHLIRPLKR